MHKVFGGLAVVMMIAACQAPPSAVLDGRAVASSPGTVDQVPQSAPGASGPTKKAPSEVALWETSHPFSLAALIDRRLKGALVDAARRPIDVAAAHALAGERGTLHRWRTGQRGQRGVIRLVRRTAPEDGRVCARLHHEHRFGRRALRGSVRICRQRGESTAPWEIDDVRWIRVGNDLAGAVNPVLTVPPSG